MGESQWGTPPHGGGATTALTSAELHRAGGVIGVHNWNVPEQRRPARVVRVRAVTLGDHRVPGAAHQRHLAAENRTSASDRRRSGRNGYGENVWEIAKKKRLL